MIPFRKVKLLIFSVALLNCRPIPLYSNSPMTAQHYCMATWGKIARAILAAAGAVADWTGIPSS